MKILVTGGAGFIGSAVIRHIIDDWKDTVVNVDCLTYAGNLETLNKLSSSDRYFFEQVDICDIKEMGRVFAENKPDAIIATESKPIEIKSVSDKAIYVPFIRVVSVIKLR